MDLERRRAVIERRFFETRLPKPVLDRISRYAQEGRELRAVFGPEGCRLVAVAAGCVPAVVLRTATHEQFAQLRTAVLLEWERATRMLQGRRHGRSSPEPLPA
jgi:hypothetical protein